MNHDAMLDAYDRALPALQRRGEAMRAAIAEWLARETGLKIHSVTLRLKSRASLEDKLARPDRSYGDLWDITDLVGLRVITYFEDSVDRVGQLVEARLPVDFEHSVDKRARRDAGAFGYRSLHYVCRMAAAADDGAGELPPRACCEVQVRTVLEHAWAEIEHDLGYKAQDTLPAAGQRRLHRLAGLLELADQEFVAIRRELEHYASSLPQRIEAASEAVPLDRLSFAALLECAEVRALDLAIAGALERPLGDEPFFPDYLLKMLASSGVHTVADARRGIESHADAIVAMVKPYFAFAWRTWSLSPGEMDRIFRGYSLFFLAHAVVLRTPSLGIDKVERLANLYRQLDYPDDERAAQRVASQLVDAFGETT
jgi:putative GTP pyrophosphokinase